MFYNVQNMKQTKLETLQAIIANQTEIRTIHKLLQVLEIPKREVLKLEHKDQELYTKLKRYCEQLVANLYELVIDRPRQATQYLQLAKEQENFYNTLFGESIESSITPEIVIKREKSSTNINVIDIKK